LVDEFQDTNSLQYAWIRLLTGPQSQLLVVGDDDQSIYGWRGARIENILAIDKDFPGTRTIRLEQNYRSTAAILKAANALISNNEGRLGKELWTAGEDGEPLKLYTAFNDFEEARFIVDRIQQWCESGHARSECAILYRSNAQSRLLEQALSQASIPYRVYGGLRFYERMEIKDALAYLRLCSNRYDDPSFERVINTPTRGIGQRSLDLIRDNARAYGTPLWQGAQRIIDEGQLPARGSNAIAQFLSLIDSLSKALDGAELWEQVEHVVAHSGLIEHFKKEKGGRGEDRIENLEELVNAARSFEPPV
ncbi:MAG: UvrD-helicase domain-containing protein, partial [Gammaproteobacteria bacterium]|nr:UvrD-helicase domain-containing protein [Gammaproteobacteria bacterium]